MGAAISFTVDSHPAPGVILPGHCYRIRRDFPPAAPPESPARNAGSRGRGIRLEPAGRSTGASVRHPAPAPPTAAGERAVLHVTYSRLALRPIECYDYLGEDCLAGKPYEMRVLLGREDFLNTTTGRIANGRELLMRTVAWGKK